MNFECRRLHQPARARCLSERLASPAGHDEPGRTLVIATALLEDAVRESASDIHLDPAADGYHMRLRIDGVLVDTVRLPRDSGLHLLRAFNCARSRVTPRSIPALRCGRRMDARSSRSKEKPFQFASRPAPACMARKSRCGCSRTKSSGRRSISSDSARRITRRCCAPCTKCAG